MSDRTLEDPPVSEPDLVDRPATFRDVLANGEFRAVFYAGGLSALGDSMARAAVTALVYQRTESTLIAAATFAISFLPWLGLGPILAALAERYPYRRTMVLSDLVRMATMALVAIPGVPVPVLLVLLFVTALFDPPFRAARSALTPRLLHGDRYVLGMSLMDTSAHLALITGYFAGGAIAAYHPHMAVLFNAATFGISACVIGLWVHHRTPALAPDQRRHLLRETAEGIGVVFGSRVLRAITLIVFSTVLFGVVPEGLAAAWAGHLTGNEHDRGWMQGLIMGSTPVGFIAGSLLINRFVGLSTRQRLIRPFAVVAPLALAAALADPNVYGTAAIALVSGFGVAALLPAANGLFVQALPDHFRARAFGVVSSGVQLCQGGAVFLTGALANRFDLPLVVGLWGAGGVVLMLLVSLIWPGQDAVARAIDRARRGNAGATVPEPAPRVQPPRTDEPFAGPRAGETTGPIAAPRTGETAGPPLPTASH
ncbi:MFS transporter [Planosporangium mesophilum]|uniref:MFS transporter n=1 Tax=Planosporangium mesophilum TaxID=689768 RepID=A0A8J3X6C3_9ACTN|nr:MFS transporter [Planosporangium mesophilum]GII25548.1 MFS transporter [Planosporangium mesophilum]